MEVPNFELSRSHKPRLKRAWLISSLIAIVGLLSTNPLETAVAAFLPVILLAILWRPGEPQALLLAMWMQSLQVIIPVLTFNRVDMSMASFLNSAAYSNAFFFSVLALICLALSARLGAGSNMRAVLQSSNILEESLNSKSLLQCYFLFLGVQLATPFLAARAGGLVQLVLPLASIRLVFAYYIIKSSIRQRKIGFSSFSILLIETVLGLTGFFSGFKSIYLVTVLAALSVGSGLRVLFRAKTLAAIMLFIFLVSYWQFIKPTYRSFVTQGAKAQVLAVPFSERLSFHSTALSNIKPDDLFLGLNTALDRVGYLKFFAGSIQRVPAEIPHQRGLLWSEAVEFATKPRILFPNKAVANDSDRTNAFSGIRVSGVRQGTSISIGYVGESYIDFGFPLMLAPIAAMGWLFGRLYRFLILLKPISPFNYGAASIFILSTATSFEASNIKLLPAAILSFIVYWFLLKLVQRFGARFSAWLTAS